MSSSSAKCIAMLLQLPRHSDLYFDHNTALLCVIIFLHRQVIISMSDYPRWHCNVRREARLVR